MCVISYKLCDNLLFNGRIYCFERFVWEILVLLNHLLLAIAPPLDETTYTAQNHKAFIGDVLREKLRELDLLGC